MTQPMSAAHQYTSSSWMSKINRWVAATRGQVAAGRVHDPLRLPGRPARVEDVQQVLGVHRLGRALGGLAVDQVVVPDVAPVGERCSSAGAAHGDHVLDRRALPHGLVGVLPSAARPGPRRYPPSAVISTFASASLIRSRSASAENPPNTTECGAPIRAHASMATGSSGTMPR